jgi:hypothetical protein
MDLSQLAQGTGFVLTLGIGAGALALLLLIVWQLTKPRNGGSKS